MIASVGAYPAIARLTLKLILSSIFLVSGILKMWDPSQHAYFPPAIGAFIGSAEALLAILLYVPSLSKLTCLAFACLCASGGVVALVGDPYKCGCMGDTVVLGRFAHTLIASVGGISAVTLIKLDASVNSGTHELANR